MGVGGVFQASMASAGGLLHDVLVAEGAEGAPGTQSPGWDRAASGLPEGDARPLVWTPSHAEPSRAVMLRS